MEEKIKIGISACLLGHNVRWDEENKQDRFITDTLGRYLEFVPVCPENECSLGTPRPALQLVGNPENPRLMNRKEKIDYTAQMMAWSIDKLPELANENLCGFIFKSKSPSCGMERIPVYQESGPAIKQGTGIFARQFMQTFPQIPAEDDGRLHDPKLRENFIETLFTLKRWRDVLTQKRQMKNLIDFHTRNKLLILSHNQKIYRQMGKLVGKGSTISIEDLFEEYESLLLEALKLKTTVKKNINVLMHMMGYFKNHLSPGEKQELLTIIDNYAKGTVPVIVPITIFNHYTRKYNQPYLRMQTYLHPHPVSLKLRNHA